MNKLRLVKLIVFLLTFAIIFGMIMAGMTIYNKVQHPKTAQSILVNLAQPAGSRINAFQTSDGILYLSISGGRLPDRIIALRTSDFSTTATINLQ